MKKMIVEDEYAISNIVAEYFTIKNVKVVHAMNGYDAGVCFWFDTHE